MGGPLESLDMRSDEPGPGLAPRREHARGEDSAIARDLSTPSDAELVEPQEVARLLDEGVTLVDLREPRAFAAAHLPGAMNIPAADLLEGSGAPSGPVILYDEDGGLIARRCSAFRQAVGEMEFFVLKGGWLAWLDAGLPVERC